MLALRQRPLYVHVPVAGLVRPNAVDETVLLQLPERPSHGALAHAQHVSSSIRTT